jgi:phospholipase D1/2
MPITALIAGTLLAFEPVRGFFYAFFGVQLAATTTYYCGRLLGGRALDHLSGPRIRKLQKLLREHAVRASAAARALPVGNFTLLNWLIGGLRVPFRWFILGNALGSLPGLLVLAIFANRLASALKNPQPEQIALLVGVGVGFMLFIWLAQRLGKRFAR